MVRYILLCMLLSPSVALAEDIRMGFGINGIYIGMPSSEVESLHTTAGCYEEADGITTKCFFEKTSIAGTRCGANARYVNGSETLDALGEPRDRNSLSVLNSLSVYSLSVYDITYVCVDPNGQVRQGLEGIFGPEYNFGSSQPEDGKWSGWRLPNKIVVGVMTDGGGGTRIKISDGLTRKRIRDLQ